MDESTLRTLYGRWLNELWNGDLAVAEEVVSRDFAIHHGAIQPGSEKEMSGPRGIVDLINMSRECFSELHFEIELGPIAQGDLICARWVGRGTYSGGFPGATADPGKKVVFRGNDILRANGGRFVEYWVCSDGPYLAQQLGAN